MTKKILISVFMFWFGILFCYAQNFPVEVSPFGFRPYPTNLSSYANSGIINGPIRLRLLLRDITTINSSRPVSLRISINGNGISVASNPIFQNTNQLTLESGIPLILGSIDLAPYFEFQNLTGISLNQYQTPLKDGLYEFCFQVFDARSNVQLSETKCVNIPLYKKAPPFLLRPINKTKIESGENHPQISFNWSPRANVSNVRYRFKMVEIMDRYVDPQSFLLGSTRFFYEKDDISQTDLQYNPFSYPDQSELTPGFTYAWQVQAYVIREGEQVNVFENDGKSEVFWFKYQQACVAPLGIDLERIAARSATLRWDVEEIHLDYTILYREKETDSRWYPLRTSRNYIAISSLKPETTYEFKVAGNCDEDNVTYSNIGEFTTLDENVALYQGCNIEPDQVNLSGKPNRDRLLENDIIRAGDFPITITKLESNTSPFKGEGYVGIPWLSLPRIGVEFDGITVNEDFQLTSGFITTTYDPDWGNVVFVDPLLEPFEGDNDAEVIRTERPVTSVTVEGGEIIITQDNGVRIEKPVGDDLTIIDSNNNTWTVDENGNVTNAGPLAEGGAVDANDTPGFSNGQITQLSAEGIEVNFIPSGRYAYDKVPDGQFDNLNNSKTFYKKIQDVNGEFYDIIHKAVENGKTDYLTAKIVTVDNSLADKLVFKNKDGIKIDHSLFNDKKEATLTLKGIKTYENEEIYATIPDSKGKETIAGVFRLWYLESKPVNVTIVPINGASVPAKSQLQNKLDQIFNSSAVYVTVESSSSFDINSSSWDVNGDGKIEVGTSGFFDTYTDEQKAFIQYYKQLSRIDPNTYYLFVTDDIKPSKSWAGFMPIKSQFGFIFNGSSTADYEKKNTTEKVIAHELGHGIFQLNHASNYGADKGKTPWLMDDKANGDDLNHMDWTQINNPDFRLYLFQNDDEGAAIISNIQGLESFRNENGSYTFLTPAGKPITIPSSLSSVVFASGDEWISSANEDVYEIIPFGTLIQFTENDNVYTGYKTGNEFIGYKNNKNEFYIDTISKTLGANLKAIIAKPCFEENLKFVANKTTNFSRKVIDGDTKGEGKVKNFDFLLGSFAQGESKDIRANFVEEFGQEAYTYIDKKGTFASCSDMLSPYIFAHAHQINKYKDIFYDCIYDKVNDELKDRGIYQSAAPFLGDGSWEDAAVTLWRNKKISTYKKFYDDKQKVASQDFQSLSKDELIDFLDKYHDIPCIWEGITPSNRLYALKKLSEGTLTNGFLFFADRESIFNLLLASATESEYHNILKLFSDTNYSILEKVYDKMNGQDADIFVNHLAKMILKKNPERPSLDYYIANMIEDNYRSDIFVAGGYNGINFKSEFNNGKISIKSKNYLVPQIGLPHQSVYPKLHNSSLNPFDVITVHISSDIAIKGLNNNYMRRGDVYHVPAIWMKWLRDRHDADERWDTFSIVIDVVVIAAAIVTGVVTGGAGFVFILAVAEASLATANIVVTLNRKSILLNNENGEELLRKWNLLNVVIGAGSLAKSGVQLIKNSDGLITKIGINSKKLYEFAKTNPKDALKLIGAMKSSVIVSLKRFRESTQNFNAYINLLIHQIYTADLITSFKNVPNKFFTGSKELAIKAKNTGYAAIVAGRLTWEMAKVSNRYDDLVLTQIVNAFSEGVVVGKLENVRYLDETGEVKPVDFDIIYDPNIPAGYNRFSLRGVGFDNAVKLSRLETNEAYRLIDENIYNKIQDNSNIHYSIRTEKPYVPNSPKHYFSQKGDGFYEIIINDKYYVKYNINTKEIAIADAKDGTFYAYAESKNALPDVPAGNTDALIKKHIITEATKLRVLAGISDNPSTLRLLGIPVTPSSSRTTTVMGRTDEMMAVKAGFGDFKSVDLGEVPGGFNFLNRPDDLWKAAGYEKWLRYHNIPWVRRAISRKDQIFLATDPNDIEKLLIAVYEGERGPSILAYELRELSIANVKPQNVTPTQWKKIQDNIEELQNQGAFKFSFGNPDEYLGIGKDIQSLSVAPKGYQFFTRNGNKWIRRLDINNPNTPRLTVKDGKIVRFVGSEVKFVANSGAELAKYLASLTDVPKTTSYKGKWYRYIGKQYDNPTEIHDFIRDANNRYEKGLYLSRTKQGNFNEINHYGGISNNKLYEITEVDVNGLLDLTDVKVIEKLGVTMDQLKLTHLDDLVQYEFAHQIAIWAKKNGYNGIKFEGARGPADYVNFVIFYQEIVNKAIKGTVKVIPW